MAKVAHDVGELFSRVGFIVTHLPVPNRGGQARSVRKLRRAGVARGDPGRQTR